MPIWTRVWRRVTVLCRDSHLVAEVRTLIAKKSPLLIVFSDGGIVSPIEPLELCVAEQVPFVTIGQANSEDWWPSDEDAHRYRKVLSAAIRCYFVSNANRRLFEKQIGCQLSNAEVVRNPFNIDFDASPPWPANSKW